MDWRHHQLALAVGSVTALALMIRWLKKKKPPEYGPKAWMRGRVIPLSEAMLPVNDWGVVHSDITYDVAPVVAGAFFRVDDYIDRFFASAAALRMDIGLSHEEVKAALCQMVAASGLRDAYVAMVVSRGVPLVAGSRDPRDCGNHFYAWCVPYVHIMQPDKSVGGGATAWVAKTVRRTPRACFDPRIKNYQWGDMTAGLLEAKEHGYDTTILLDQDGCVTEGPGFNVFSVQSEGRLVTAESGMLEGISRRTVLEICRAEGYAVEVRSLPLEELMRGEEIFITSTAGGVMPVTRVDDRTFHGGAPGPVARRIRERYWEMVRKPEMRTDILFAA